MSCTVYIEHPVRAGVPMITTTCTQMITNLRKQIEILTREGDRVIGELREERDALKTELAKAFADHEDYCKSWDIRKQITALEQERDDLRAQLAAVTAAAAGHDVGTETRSELVGRVMDLRGYYDQGWQAAAIEARAQLAAARPFIEAEAQRLCFDCTLYEVKCGPCRARAWLASNPSKVGA